MLLFNAEVMYAIWSRKERLAKYAAVAAICLLLFTNFLLLFPAIFFKGPLNSLSLTTLPDSTRERFVDRSLQPRFYFADYVYGIANHYESPLDNTIAILKNGSAGDTVLYPTNWDMIEPYTTEMGMRVSYRIEEGSFNWIIWEDYRGDIEKYGINISGYRAAHYTIPSYINDSNIDMPDLVHYRFASGGAPRMNMTAYKLTD